MNPDHLFLGTIGDNNADRHWKGRSKGPRGESHGRAKLDADKVMKILIDTRTAGVVAKEYGVGRSCVNKIRQGLSWKDVPRA